MIYHITHKEEQTLQKLEALGVKFGRMLKRTQTRSLTPTDQDTAHYKTLQKWVKEVMAHIREE